MVSGSNKPAQEAVGDDDDNAVKTPKKKKHKALSSKTVEDDSGDEDDEDEVVEVPKKKHHKKWHHTWYGYVEQYKLQLACGALLLALSCCLVSFFKSQQITAPPPASIAPLTARSHGSHSSR